MTRVCPICERQYDADPKRLKHGRQTTCSRKCSYDYRALQLRREVRLQCLCGKWLSRIPSRAGRSAQHFCNTKCRIKFLKAKAKPKSAKVKVRSIPRSWEYICFYCDKKFAVSYKKHSKRTFCDRGCYEKQKSEDMSGSKNPMYGKAPDFKPIMWKQGWHIVGQHRCYFRSSWELAVARYLESQDLIWEYEYRRYRLRSLNKTYVPDFFILNNNTIEKIIEVKGWMKQKDRDKIASFRSEYNIPLEVWQRKELRLLNLLDCNGYGVFK